MENKLSIIKSLGFEESRQENSFLDIINSYNELYNDNSLSKKYEISNKFNDSLGDTFDFNDLLNIVINNKDILYTEFKLNDKFIEYIKLIMLNEQFHNSDDYYDGKFEYELLNQKLDIDYLSDDSEYIANFNKDQILQIFSTESLNYKFIFNKYIIRFFNNLLKYNKNIDKQILSEIINCIAYEKSTIELILNHNEFDEELLKILSADHYEAENDALELIKNWNYKMNDLTIKEIKNIFGLAKYSNFSNTSFEIITNIINDYRKFKLKEASNKEIYDFTRKYNLEIYRYVAYNDFYNSMLNANYTLLDKVGINKENFLSFIKSIIVNSASENNAIDLLESKDFKFFSPKIVKSESTSFISEVEKFIYRASNFSKYNKLNSETIKSIESILKNKILTKQDLLLLSNAAYKESTVNLIIAHELCDEEVLNCLLENDLENSEHVKKQLAESNIMIPKNVKDIFLEKSNAKKHLYKSNNVYNLVYDFFINFKELDDYSTKQKIEHFSNYNNEIKKTINYDTFNKFINDLDNSFFDYYKIDESAFKQFLNTLLVNSCLTFDVSKAWDIFTDFGARLGLSVEINNDILYLENLSKDNMLSHFNCDNINYMVFNKVYVEFLNNLLKYNKNLDEDILRVIINNFSIYQSTNDLIINHESFDKDTMFDLLLNSNLSSDEQERILKLKNENLKLKENEMNKAITEITNYNDFVKLFDSGKHDKEELFNKINFIPNSHEELLKLYSIYKNRIFTESFDLSDISEDIVADFICSLPIKEVDSLTPWLKIFNLESYDGEFEAFTKLSEKSKKFKQIAFNFALNHFHEYIYDIGYDFSDCINDDGEIVDLVNRIADSFNDDEYKEKFIKNIIENYENAWLLFYAIGEYTKCNIMFDYIYGQDNINILGEIFSALGKIVEVNANYIDLNEEHIAEMIDNLDAKDFNKLKKIEFGCMDDQYSAESIFNIYQNLAYDKKDLFLNTIKNMSDFQITEDEYLSKMAKDFINFNKFSLSDFFDDSNRKASLSDNEVEFIKSINKPIIDKFISISKNKELNKLILECIESEQQVNKKPVESLNKNMKEEKEPSKKSEAMDWYKSRLLEGTYQGIAKEAVDKAIDLIVVASGNKEGVRDFLKSEIGFALVSGAVGSALHFVPFEQLQDAKVQKIADKCVENSVSSGVSKVIDTVVKFILPAVSEASSKFRVETLDSLPDPNTRIEEDESELVREVVGFSKSSR